MKKLIIAALLLSAFVSCHKKEEPIKINLCDSQYCQQYYNIWKNLFLKRNNISEEYFNEHITPFRSGINDWAMGSSFNISYQVKVDWVVCNRSDQFIVKTKPDEYIFPALTIRRGVYLNEDEIAMVLDSNCAFNSQFNHIKPIDHMAFNSEKDALNVMKAKAGTKKVSSNGVSYDENGDPVLNGWAELDRNANSCLGISLNLVSSDCKLINGMCWVD